MIRQICVERSHWGLSRYATGLPFFPSVHKIDLERGIKVGFKWVLLNFFTSRILFSPFYQNNLYNFIFKCCSYPHDEFGQRNKLIFSFKPQLFCLHLSMQYWRFGGGGRRNPSHLNFGGQKHKTYFSHIIPRRSPLLMSSLSLQHCGFIPWKKRSFWAR